MNLVLALDGRFLRTPDGRHWSTTIYPRSFWDRYLGVFEKLVIVARVAEIANPRPGWKRVDDADRVTFVDLPSYIGPAGFIRNFLRIRATIRTLALDRFAILLRVPGMIPSAVASCLKSGQPYGIEVVGDPYDVFSPGASPHPLRPFFRWWFTRTLRRQCRQAACSLYLTDKALQARYPPASGSLSVAASESDLEDAAFAPSTPVGGKYSTAEASRRFRLIFVGTLEALYKAPDVLVAAFAQCLAQGLDGELFIVGDGRERPRLERLTRQLNVAARVKFLGQLPGGEAILRELDAADLFVLPSRQEGLPKAMIEAMARGLPCIGSRVGGIPELLSNEALVPPNNVAALTAKICQIARDRDLRASLAASNLNAARRYHEKNLQPARVRFYRELAELTRRWQESALAPVSCTAQ